MRNLLLTLLGIVVALGCQENDDQPGCPQIIIKEDISSFSRDQVSIKDASLTGNLLHLTVSYGGGCGETDFKLISTPHFMESHPVQVAIILSFKDDDPCKAIVEKDLCFDLSALASLYKQAYQTSSGTIILNIDNISPSPRYSF